MSAPTKRPHPFFISAGLKVDGDGGNDSSKRAKSGAATDRRRAPTAPRLAAPPSPLPPPALLGPHFPAPLPRAPRDPAAFVALSWNVAGLAALLRKDPEALSRLVASEGADALCIQEHKLQTEKKAAKGGKDGAREIFGGGGCGANKLGLPGWHITWACSTKPKHLGLSGVAIASRVEPLSVRIGIGNGDAAAAAAAAAAVEGGDGAAASSGHDHDVEGRFVAVEFERFWLATTYVPNSGEGLRRLRYRVGDEMAGAAATAESGLPEGTPCWDQALAKFIAGLKNASSSSCSPKPVVLMGDLNCARTPMDIYTTKGKEKSAGFTPQERESFERRILGQQSAAAAAGLRDVWRERHPERIEYTYWSYRGRNYATNRGWRLDYTLVHPELAGGRAAGKKGSGNGNREDSDGEDEGGSDGVEEEEEENAAKSLIHDVFHLPHVRGSDHCPIGVTISAEGHGEELV